MEEFDSEKKSINKTMMTLKDKEKIKDIVMERRVQRNQELNTLEESFKKQINNLKASLSSK